MRLEDFYNVVDEDGKQCLSDRRWNQYSNSNERTNRLCYNIAKIGVILMSVAATTYLKDRSL